MKTFFKSKTIIALAVAIAATAANATNVNEQPIPPPTYESSLPANIQPGSSLAEVYKLAQANVDISVITSYITNCSGAFNLDADKIIALTDVGAPSEIINLMIAHDKNSALMVAPEAPAPNAVTAVPPVDSTSTRIVVAPPKTEVTVQYFQETLSPYGGWVEVEGYGRCWRPSVVVYDTSWRPYCDRGRWVYSDCGWYWDSDYAWGATFHYGRWFNHSRYGWCWWPDTTWGASWVSWRSGGDYCGWAPLPPLSVYRPGLGFYYRGSGVSLGFDFGLSVSSYTFISVGRLCDRRPRYYCEDSRRGAEIYHNTTVINNYNYNDRRHVVINNGVSVERVSSASRRPIQPVAVNDLPNASRHGWRGENSDRDGRRNVSDNNLGRNNPGNQTRPGAGGRDERVGSPTRPDGNNDRRSNVGQPRSPQNDNVLGRYNNSSQPENRNVNRERNVPNRNGDHTSQNLTPPANATGSPVIIRDQPRRVDSPVICGAVQNNRLSYSGNTVDERTQIQRERRQFEQTQRQFTPTPNTPSVLAPQNNWQQNRRTDSGVVASQPQRSAPQIVTTPPQRSAPQIEQRPIFTPQAPKSVVTPTAPAVPERSQNRVENRPTSSPTAPNYTPPAVNEYRSPARAERAAERNADREKKDR